MWPHAPVLNSLKCMPYLTSSNLSAQELNHHWKPRKLKIKLKDEEKGIISIPLRETALHWSWAAAKPLLRLRTWLCVSAGSLQRSQTKSRGISMLPLNQKVPSCSWGWLCLRLQGFPLQWGPFATCLYMSSLCSCKGKSPTKGAVYSSKWKAI